MLFGGDDMDAIVVSLGLSSAGFLRESETRLKIT
jgi:hypothetical protein